MIVKETVKPEYLHNLPIQGATLNALTNPTFTQLHSSDDNRTRQQLERFYRLDKQLHKQIHKQTHKRTGCKH